MRLDVGGPPLGIFPDWAYEEHRVAFGPGDRLVVFTDGITESGTPPVTSSATIV